jgi:pimeloyl-ACP methyl ester carboxylesterase
LDVRTETSLSAAERALGLPESGWLDDGGPVHYREWPGPADGTVSVLVHGLGGSLLNWALVAPDLENVFLFGSSMGGMVAVEHAAADPASVRGLVLVSAALPPVGSPVRGVPTEVAAGFLATGAWRLGPAILRTRTDRLGAERMARRTLAYCTAHPDRLDPAWVAAPVEEFRRWSAGLDAADVFSEACRSIVRAFTFPCGYRRLLAEIRTPAIVLHGAADRLIPTANAWQAARDHANWDLVVLPDTGHIPQVEDPAGFLDVVGAWLDRAAA